MSVPELQRLRAEHGSAVLAFEVENRAYFSAWISDRGDEFFEHFGDRFDELIAEQEEGRCACYVLLEPDGAVIGRFNLVEIRNGAAELGFRVAQRVAGRGVATAAVEELCREAASQIGLHELRARVSHENIASQKVLATVGFVPTGVAEVGSRTGTWYRLDLPIGFARQHLGS
jgi:ribosomal-protein-alanine N-acetyltransferase